MSRRIETLRELQGYTLDVLKFIDGVCREHKLTWFLSGGSALGAVRHKGFIPWDDDADIMFPRADYERFLEIMAEREAQGKNGIYRFGSVHNRADWTFPFARVWNGKTRVVYRNLNEAPTGVFVDIYPMDGLPDSMRRTKLYYICNRLLFFCLICRIRKEFKPGEGKIALKKALALLLRPVKPRSICARIDRMARRRDFNKCRFVGCTVLSHYMSRERFPRAAFERGVLMDFEDTQLPVPNGCHDYLSALYGDYMTPPSREQQIAATHTIEVYVDD